MRVSKDPEVRKQEIIDTAMKLFSEKGYEFTSISDIAKEMNVVSGLCYRYFKSKEELYKTALDMYAKECSAPIINFLKYEYDTIDECFNKLSENFFNTDGKEKYHNFFHNSANVMFSNQLSNAMCTLIEPHLSNLLKKWQDKNLINITNPELTASFILYGQMPIINNDMIPSEEKVKFIISLIRKVLC